MPAGTGRIFPAGSACCLRRAPGRWLRLLFAAGAGAVFALMVMEVLELPRTPFLSLTRGFLSGAAFGVLLLGVLSTTPAMARLQRAKLGLLRRLRPRRDSGKSEN